MRIAVIAPPWLPIPPEGYGGIERVLANLVKELTTQGHEVILYTVGGSKTAALQKWIFPEAQAPIGDIHIATAHLSFAYKDAIRSRVDIIHDHSSHGEGAVVGSHVSTPVLHTVHGPLRGNMRRIYHPVRNDIGFLAISDFQRRKMPSLNWISTVYNPVDPDDIPLCTDKKDYLLYLGRIAGDKGTALACEVAKRTGEELVVAGDFNDERERAYFEQEVKPYFKLPNITYVGEVAGEQRRSLYAHAKAFLFPIQWEEPFGLAPLEANLAGTPAIVIRNGSMSELIRDGETGFLVDDVEGMVEAVSRVGEIDPKACRDFVVKTFSSKVVTDRYIAASRKLLSRETRALPRTAEPAPELNFFEKLIDRDAS